MQTLLGLFICFVLVNTGLLVRGANFSQSAVTVFQGDNATLSCSKDQQVRRMAWFNRSDILYAGNDKWSIDPRVKLLTNSPSEFSLVITHVDVYDEGPYTCSFEMQDMPHTLQVYLIVHVPARIVNISSAVTVNEGSNVNLLCLAVGNPEPTVTWRQLKGGFTSEGEYLEITEINRQQAGEYECIAANGGLASDSKRVLITVNRTSLECEVCTSVGTNCQGEMEVCEDGKDTCAIIVTDSAVDGYATKTIVKSCAYSKACTNKTQYIEYGSQISMRAGIACCQGEACRTTLPELAKPLNKTQRNGKQCPACFSVFSHSCTENETVECLGPEDHCIELEGSVTYGPIALKTVQKGCVTKGLCADLSLGEAKISGIRSRMTKAACKEATFQQPAPSGQPQEASPKPFRPE